MSKLDEFNEKVVCRDSRHTAQHSIITRKASSLEVEQQ